MYFLKISGTIYPPVQHLMPENQNPCYRFDHCLT